MKKPFLLSASLLSLGLITAIYAQTTTTGGSIVDKMKAAAHSFSLSSVLNPTDTGLTSDPIKGKKTGDMLTAGEWNRVLELVSEGGSGGGSGWADVPLTDTADFDMSCEYKFDLDFVADDINQKWMNSTSAVGHSSLISNKFLFQVLSGNILFGIPSTNKNQYGSRDSAGVFTNYTNVRVTSIKKRCGGGGSGSSTGSGEMVMSEMSPTTYVNLIDAVNYCRNLTENGITHWRFPTYGDLVNFIDPKYPQDMIWVADFDGTQVASQMIVKDYFGSIRLSDGYWSVSTPADGANKVRCVAQAGGGSTSTTCPSGFVAVGSYCIEPTMGPAGKDWYEASVACADKGGQLCSWSEWSTACQKSKLTDVVFGSGGKYEWIDDYSIANQGIADPIVYSSCKYLSRQADTTKAANTTYRCCAPKN